MTHSGTSSDGRDMIRPPGTEALLRPSFTAVRVMRLYSSQEIDPTLFMRPYSCDLIHGHWSEFARRGTINSHHAAVTHADNAYAHSGPSLLVEIAKLSFEFCDILAKTHHFTQFGNFQQNDFFLQNDQGFQQNDFSA